MTQRYQRILFVLGGLVFLLVAAFYFRAPEAPDARETLVFTQVFLEGDSEAPGRFPARSRLVALNPEDPAATPRILTEGFHAARAPEISFDGRRLLFSGRRASSDPWQIWEMQLDNGKIHPVTESLHTATDPAYLPDDRIVFSDRPAPDALLALYTTQPEGMQADRISFHPEADFGTTLLSDGSILFNTGAPSALRTMRYDGTGQRLLYQHQQPEHLQSRAYETAGGQLVFIASERLIATELKRPLHTRRELAPNVPGQFHSVFPTSSGMLLVSYRPGPEVPFAVYEFDPVQQALGRRLFEASDVHAVEPVVIASRPRPLGFVSPVDPEKKVGWFYSMDANHSTLPAPVAAHRVRIMSPNGLLAEVPLETDGSFHFEVPADTPLRFLTVTEDGQVVRGPSAWVWVRPNEQRGCIGCHEDRELVPENRVPLAITRPAVPVQALPTDMAVADDNDQP